jgi:cellulose 1,4-beta-cellobiosidase
MFKLLTILLVSPLVMSQQPGTLTAENHPKMTWEQCHAGGQCTQVNGEVVLDANWRWIHNSQGQNCYTGNKWDATSCPDDATCAKNCALDGAQYQGTYGVATNGNALSLTFVTQSQNKNIGSRLYLMASETKYQMFKLLNQEFTFDVDVSKLPCGLNGALYLVSMDEDGGTSKHPTNKAGAKFGTGYCDSQCPRDIKFINGEANPEGWVGTTVNSGNGKHGSCCAEMDLWEANSMSAAYTPHPCTQNAIHVCTGDACGGGTSPTRYASDCDPDGCDFNSYRMGNTSFYGPGKTVDTTKVFTVVTQFIASASGDLNEIKRFYVQGGKVIPNSMSTVAGVTGNSITQDFCTKQKSVFKDKDSFTQHGGLKHMGDAIKAGMVLVLSFWDDYAVDMLWLDSPFPKDAPVSQPGVVRGSCATTSGVPAEVEAQYPNAKVVYSNIRVGPINSTFTH